MALAAIPPAVPFHSIIGQKIPGPVHTGTDAWSPIRAATSTAPNLKRSFLLVMKLSSTRPLSPRSSGYFARTSRPCKSRGLRLRGISRKTFSKAYIKALSCSLAPKAQIQLSAWGNAPGNRTPGTPSAESATHGCESVTEFMVENVLL